jgi:hypothetical protein
LLLHQNIPCDPGRFLSAIGPFREDMVVGVECIFTWYGVAGWPLGCRVERGVASDASRLEMSSACGRVQSQGLAGPFRAGESLVEHGEETRLAAVIATHDGQQPLPRTLVADAAGSGGDAW